MNDTAPHTQEKRQPHLHLATPVAHLFAPGKLHWNNATLLFRPAHGNVIRLAVPPLHLVLLYGPVQVTSAAATALLRRGVHLAWLSRTGGSCLGRLVPPRDPALRLRQAQHLIQTQPHALLQVAQKLVAHKIASQIDALRHFQRHGTPQLGPKLAKLAALKKRARQVKNLDSLRGLEGLATTTWYSTWAQRLKPPWQFQRRQRRPPSDPVNALLSLGYTWLTQRAAAMAQAHGLEVDLGTLHAPRPGRPSLACDLVEPLRVPLVDRWVSSLCNRQVVLPEHFQNTPPHGVRLLPKKLPQVIVAWDRHAQENQLPEKLAELIRTYCRWLKQAAQALQPPEQKTQQET